MDPTSRAAPASDRPGSTRPSATGVEPNEIDLYARDLLRHVLESLGEGYGELGLDTPLIEIGILDSFTLQELLSWIEDRYEVLLPPEKLRPESFNSARQMAAVVIASIAGATATTESDYFEVLNRLVESHGLTRRWLDLPSGRLHSLATAGKGDPTLILLAGLGTPASSWGLLMRSLNHARRIVALDLPGFGVSPPGTSEDFSFASQVGVVLEAIDAIGADPFVVVGHSAGAMIAADVARLRPAQCHGILSIAFGRVRDGAAWWRRLRALSQDPDGFWQDAFYSPPPLSGMLRARLDSILSSPAYREFLDEPAVRRLDTMFADVCVPTLFLGGQDDRIIEPAVVEGGAAQVDGAELAWIARCGHNVQIERPEEVRVYLEHFLRRVALEGGTAAAPGRAR